MSIAFKCDKCGELFTGREQEVSVSFQKKYNSYLNVAVGSGHDLCRKCVRQFLKMALEKIT